MSPAYFRKPSVWGGAPTGSPAPVKRNAYLRYFSEVCDEYTSHAEKLETRLLDGRAVRGHPLKRISNPACELDDVCCITAVTHAELREVLPSMFDAYRRLERARAALSEAYRVSRPKRLELATEGLDVLMEGLGVGTEVEAEIERTIDQWLDGMMGPCQWSDADHYSSRCRKPVPWSKAAMGGGRSEQ